MSGLNELNKPKKPIYVLSLDGGGIRGVLELIYLNSLEKKMNKTIHQIFHTIIGTSTGGLITLLLTVPQKNGEPTSAENALQIYKELGPQIFPEQYFWRKFVATVIFFVVATCIFIWVLPDDTIWKIGFWIIIFLACLYPLRQIYNWWSLPKYSAKNLIDFCNKHFKEGATLKDAKTNIGIVATDIQYRKAFVFNKVRADIDENCLLHGAKISKIARATSAAPTYFPPEEFDQLIENSETFTPWDSTDLTNLYNREKIIFEDGGTVKNNPSKSALKLVEMKLNKDDSDPQSYEIKLLSIGTGTISGEQDDPTRYKKIGWLNWLKHKICSCFRKLDGGKDNVFYRRLLDDPFEVALKAYNTHLSVKQQFEKKGLLKNYKRIQFKITYDQLENMDDSSSENIDSLIKSAENKIYKNRKTNTFTEQFVDVIDFLNNSEDIPEQIQSSRKNPAHRPEQFATSREVGQTRSNNLNPMSKHKKFASLEIQNANSIPSQDEKNTTISQLKKPLLPF